MRLCGFVGNKFRNSNNQEANYLKVIELAKELISKDEVKNKTVNFLGDSVSALSGNQFAAAKIIYTLMRSPMFFREQLFWTKFEMFLNGIDTTTDERMTFCARLDLDGRNKDSAYRLIQIIDRAETDRKINYLINVSKCLARDLIGRPSYFRICHTIVNSLEEDLIFLKNHILENCEYEYGDSIQGLMNNGLIYQSVIDANGNDRYKFTLLAKVVDRYALSYDNIERYSMYEKSDIDIDKKVTEVDAIARFG